MFSSRCRKSSELASNVAPRVKYESARMLTINLNSSSGMNQSEPSEKKSLKNEKANITTAAIQTDFMVNFEPAYTTVSASSDQRIAVVNPLK